MIHNIHNEMDFFHNHFDKLFFSNNSSKLLLQLSSLLIIYFVVSIELKLYQVKAIKLKKEKQNKMYSLSTDTM